MQNQALLKSLQNPCQRWYLTLVVPPKSPRWQPFGARYTRFKIISCDDLKAYVAGLGTQLFARFPGAMDAFEVLDDEGQGAIRVGLQLQKACHFEDLRLAVENALKRVKLDWHLSPHCDDWPQRKRLLISDMDSTLLEGECIDELAEGMGCKTKVAEITEKAMRGELDFEAALRERVALLKGLSSDYIAHVLAHTPVMENAALLVNTMKAHGAHTVIVSGGFTPFTQALTEKLGMHAHHANTLEIENGCFTGAVLSPVFGREAKLETLQRTLKTLNLEPEDALALGDGANDLAMLQASGLGIAFHAKDAVEAAANARIRFGTLETALYFQGFRRDEFVLE